MSAARSRPRVSVIVTVFNLESYVGDAIESLLAQTCGDLEIVVVDDHSADGSWKIIEHYASQDGRIRAFRNERNLRQTRTRNFALRQTTGEYIAQLDGDDVRTPSSIAAQVAFLEAHPDVVAVGGGAEICDADMRPLNYRLYPTTDAAIRRAFFRYSPFCLPSLVIRRSALDDDAFDPAMEPAEDIDLSFRLGVRGKLANLPEVIYRSWTHPKSVSQTYTREMEKKTLAIRLKAAREYGYYMSPFDRAYFAAQLTTMYVMPATMRFWVFEQAALDGDLVTRYRVAYHMPYPTTVYAARYVYLGFKNAFSDMGHEFLTYSPGTDLATFLRAARPDVFITASHFLYRKQLDYGLLRNYRSKGMVLLTKIDFWRSPMARSRINEAPSMADDATAKALIKQGLMGDAFFSTVAQGDERMDGFASFAGSGYRTIPLAADRVGLASHPYNARFRADISFIGTYLPQKRQAFDELLFPLRSSYDLRLYGQDWSRASRLRGLVTKVGQYFNLPGLRSLQRAPLTPEDEGSIYASSRVLVNIHEDYQRTYGGDCNERTFKIPFCSGFQICDDVRVVSEYFRDGEEIVVARSREDWFDKVGYYFEHEDEARAIAAAGRERVLRDHTYHRRAEQILALL